MAEQFTKTEMCFSILKALCLTYYFCVLDCRFPITVYHGKIAIAIFKSLTSAKDPNSLIEPLSKCLNHVLEALVHNTTIFVS